jgi:hypothetical protein
MVMVDPLPPLFEAPPQAASARQRVIAAAASDLRIVEPLLL